jgi:hypothetical protein
MDGDRTQDIRGSDGAAIGGHGGGRAREPGGRRNEELQSGTQRAH